MSRLMRLTRVIVLLFNAKSSVVKCSALYSLTVLLSCAKFDFSGGSPSRAPADTHTPLTSIWDGDVKGHLLECRIHNTPDDAQNTITVWMRGDGGAAAWRSQTAPSRHQEEGRRCD